MSKSPGSRHFCLCLLIVWGSASTIWAEAPSLPTELQVIKQQVIEIAAANTTRLDNIQQVRSELNPLVAELGDWFAANRPENELQLTQVAWRNLWYDDDDIGFDFDLGIFGLQLDRRQIYQVIEDGFYYNVSELVLQTFGIEFRLQSYLKGAYEIVRKPTDENRGDPRLNTVDLEFVDNRVQFGGIPRLPTLSQLVVFVDTFPFVAIPVPGPNGVTGELWNVYVDDELRIAAGFDDREPEIIDLYILLRTTRVED